MPGRIVPGRVYMVTRRCTQRQLLLPLDRETTNAFIYCLALAAERTEMRVLALMAHSNDLAKTSARGPRCLATDTQIVRGR